jgi:hypothetical protein
MLTQICYELYDADEYRDFVKHVVKQFRGSPEYSMWLNSFNRNECAATGLTRDADGVPIEVHHFRITLWGWVEYIIDKFYQENLPLNSFYICLILTDIHFNRCIPCVPLTHCIHKMLHENYDDTLAKYPEILENVWQGDTARADELIDYHIQNYKKQLTLEEELINGKAG